MRLIPAEYTEVYLAGELGKKFGRVRRLVCKTPLQALKLIYLQCPEFKQYMLEKAKEGARFHVICDKRSRTTEQLTLPAGKRLIISPEVAGAKGGLGSILEAVAGVALIAVAVLQPEIAPALWIATGINFSAGAALAVGSIGASLLLSGVTQLLSPQPPGSSASYYFNGASNTVTQGPSVPVVYGRMLVGGLPISSSLQAVDSSAAGVESGLVTG